jgi:hypothetical protein
MASMPHQNQGLLGAIGAWWQGRQKSRTAPANSDAPRLRTLAGKWPDSADLLSHHLAALQTSDRIKRERDEDCQHNA